MGRLLPMLRGDLKGASKSLKILCPWLDEYFADQIARVSSSELHVHVVVRPQAAVDARMWPHMTGAIQILRDRFSRIDVRGLATLHAKSIVIDDRIVHVGSTNFYRYSLEKSVELGLRVLAANASGLVDEIDQIIDGATELIITGAPRRTDVRGVDIQVDDPEVLRILEENPKAWVLGKKQR